MTIYKKYVNNVTIIYIYFSYEMLNIEWSGDEDLFPFIAVFIV